MEPHDKLFGFCIVNHFRTLNDGSLGDVVFRILRDLQCDAFVPPVIQVIRCVDMYAHLCGVSGIPLDLVFPEPVIGAFMKKDSAAVGIDMHPLVVGPYLAGLKGRKVGSNARTGQ